MDTSECPALSVTMGALFHQQNSREVTEEAMPPGGDPILGYVLQWHPGHDQGRILIRVQNNPQPINLPVNSPQEFAAIAAVLNQSPAFFYPATGVIASGWDQ